jgi:DNA excision repair protein ERCC-4
MINCKICKKSFLNDKSFHCHLKQHGIYSAEYYCKYYPRFSLFYKQQIPFVNKKDYFNREFINSEEFKLWQENADLKDVKSKCVGYLKQRIEEKKYNYAPFYNELKTLDLPSIDTFKKLFKSYNAACRTIGCEPLYNKNIPSDFFDISVSDFVMLVDTREQDPLPFKNSKKEKLYIGDYLIEGTDYNYTYVDRKSESDFLVTLGLGRKRFEREIQKAQSLDSYIFVVIESSIENLKFNQKRYKRKSHLEFIFHNMRHLSHKYARNIQFVFTGDRAKSIEIIPKILYMGKKLWNVDLQYFLDQN